MSFTSLLVLIGFFAWILLSLLAVLALNYILKHSPLDTDLWPTDRQ